MYEFPLCINVRPISHKFYLLVTLGIFFSYIPYLSGQSLKFRQYKTDDGLPHDVGYDIHQDKQGFIWIAVDNGLTRFDGLNFQNYTVEDGLNGPFVITLSEDAQGAIWSGIHLKGISHISKDKISSVNIPITIGDPKVVHHKSGDWLFNENTPSPQRFSSLIGIQKKDSAVGNFTWYAFRLENQKVVYEVLEGEATLKENLYKSFKIQPGFTPINTKLKQLKDGRVFILSGKGAFTYNPSSLIQAIPKNELPAANYIDLDEDLEGNIWLLSADSLYKLQAGKLPSVYPLPAPLTSGLQLKVIDEEKIFVLDNSREKLFKLNLQTEKYEDLGPMFRLNSLISFIEKDQEKNLWFTTMGDGLFCLYNHEFNNYSTNQGLSNTYINSIKEDRNGNILICTLKGINKMYNGKIDKANWYFNSSFAEKHDFKEVFDIYPTQNGSYLLSIASYGTIIISPDAKQNKRIHTGAFKKLKIYDEDSLAIIRYDFEKEERFIDFWNLKNMQRNSHVVLGLPTNILYNAFVFPITNHRGYWASLDTGLVQIIDYENSPYSLPQEYSEVKFNDITQDKDGNTWFASEKGVLMYDGSDMHIYSQEYNWPEFQCRQVLFDQNNNLWMASPNGLYVWDQKELTRYSTTDGMISNDIRSIFIDSKQQLWLGTSFGVSSIKLEQFPLIASPPKLMLTEVSLDNQPVNLDTISYISQQDKLSISYFALSYVAPEKLEYAYQLNENEDWQISKTKSLELSKLPKGAYQLQLKTRKFNSEWSEPIQFDFEVLPPWWKRIWAYILFGVGSMGIIFSITYFWGLYVRKKAEAKSRVEYEIAQLKLQALQSQLNPHFIFNSLNVIQGYILENDVIASNTYLERFSHLMRRFLESSKKNKIFLSEEIELLNLFVEMEQLCYEDRFTFTLEIDRQLRLEHTKVPSMLIQPFVENSIHHGLLKKKGKGKLLISFEKTKDKVLCTIIDDGIGRKESEQLRQQSQLTHVSRGMQIVSERLKIQNYLERENIEVEIFDIKDSNKQIAGTKVEISWPLKEF